MIQQFNSTIQIKGIWFPLAPLFFFFRSHSQRNHPLGIILYLNFIPLFEWIWCQCVHDVSMRCCQFACTYMTTKRCSWNVEMLACMYRCVMTSHPFSKWDKVTSAHLKDVHIVCINGQMLKIWNTLSGMCQF